jgi:hypothetical protein
MSTRRAPWTRTSLAVTAYCAILLGPSDLAAQEVQLRWKFEPGESHVYRQDQSSRAGTPMGDVVQTQSSTLRQEVLRVDAQGVADVRVTYDALRMVNDGPMGRQEYDSDAAPDLGESDLALFGALVGRSFGMRVAPDGSVLEVSGLAEMVDEMLDIMLGDAPEEMVAEVRGMMESTFGDEAMRSVMQQGLQALPAHAVAPGATWGFEVEMPLPFGSTTHAYTYTLREVARDGGREVAMIDITGTMGELVPDPDSPIASLISLTGGTVAGQIEFDVLRGRMLRTTMETVVSMTVMGQTMETRATHRMELVGGR